MTNKVKVGLIGCGNISDIYLKNCTRFDILDVVACADLDMARAQAKAQQYGIPQALTASDLLADPAIDLVLNLTTPNAHAEIALAAVQAGKSIYNEKPLTIRRDDAQALLAAAAGKGVLVGGAPDTFMGGGLQTCRKLIDDGLIGKPVSAVAFMTCHGHESWHPDPEFYYKVGGGPMFDMGPYYLTALVALIGPVQRVTGATQITFRERLITSQPKAGTRISVDVPTHVTGLLEFADGATGMIMTSFDVWASELPIIEIHGTEGTTERSRSEQLRRDGARPAAGRSRMADRTPHSRLHRKQPRAGCRGYGVCAADRHPSARQRGTDLSRAGHHARHS